MFKKIQITIVALNLFLFISQVIFSINLSTQGDILSQKLSSAQSVKMEVDLLEKQIAEKSSLDQVYQKAKILGFVPVKIIKLGSITLATAK